VEVAKAEADDLRIEGSHRALDRGLGVLLEAEVGELDLVRVA
jgi:hypothetical protein